MNNTNEANILFDDFSILTKLIGKKDFIIPPANHDCDCIGYSSTPIENEIDTVKIATTIGQTNR